MLHFDNDGEPQGFYEVQHAPNSYGWFVKQLLIIIIVEHNSSIFGMFNDLCVISSNWVIQLTFEVF